jgi:uncharacterized membrane protein (GlpM family)
MLIETVVAGLSDPFRIGLLIALYATMLRTQAATGSLIPLAAGVVFVAVIIPATMGHTGGTLATSIMAGLLSNIVIVAVIAALWAIYRRLRG